MTTNTAKTWTLKHENETTMTPALPSVSLKLAHECGYRWVNRGDGKWMQISWLMKRLVQH